MPKKTIGKIHFNSLFGSFNSSNVEVSADFVVVDADVSAVVVVVVFVVVVVDEVVNVRVVNVGVVVEGSKSTLGCVTVVVVEESPVVVLTVVLGVVSSADSIDGSVIKVDDSVSDVVVNNDVIESDVDEDDAGARVEVISVVDSGVK